MEREWAMDSSGHLVCLVARLVDREYTCESTVVIYNPSVVIVVVESKTHYFTVLPNHPPFQ